MPNNYTPTTNAIREIYAGERHPYVKTVPAYEEFDRWLAEVERAAAIKAIEDASDEIELGDWSHHGNLSDRSNAEAEASTWLDKRAISLRARAAALGLTAGQEGGER